MTAPDLKCLSEQMWVTSHETIKPNWSVMANFDALTSQYAQQCMDAICSINDLAMPVSNIAVLAYTNDLKGSGLTRIQAEAIARGTIQMQTWLSGA